MENELWSRQTMPYLGKGKNMLVVTKEEQWADNCIQHARRLSQAFWEGCSFKDEVELIGEFLFSLAVYSQSS